jgi:hypothetical protein
MRRISFSTPATHQLNVCASYHGTPSGVPQIRVDGAASAAVPMVAGSSSSLSGPLLKLNPVSGFEHRCSPMDTFVAASSA